MANYTIVNGNSTALTDVNGGGTDLDPHSYKDGVTLTNTELATLLDGSTFGKDVAVMSDKTGDAQAQQRKRAAALAALYASA